MVEIDGGSLPYVMGRSLVEDAIDVQSLLHLTVIPLGLVNLASAQKVYIFQHSDKIPFPTEFPSVTNYVIVNDLCERINVVAELNTRGTDKDFIMHMFTPEGSLVVKMIQRHKQMWKTEHSADFGDLNRYLERDRQLPSLIQRRTSENAPEYEIVDDKPDAHIHVELADGAFLGTLWRSETAWVVHDSFLIPIYTMPEDPDPRHPTPKRQPVDVVYNYYSAGAEINSFTGPPLGRIETNVDLETCGPEALNWVCIGIRFPDHFNVVDKTLILGVALNQYCRIVPLSIKERQEVNPSTHKCFLFACTALTVIILALGIFIVAGLAFTFFYKYSPVPSQTGKNY
jgi:hypothetical protein